MCAIPLDKSNRTKQARHCDDYQHGENATTRTTDKERPDSEPTSVLELVHYILNNCDDHQLERFAFAFVVLHSSFYVHYSFIMHSRTKLEKALEGVPYSSDIVTMIELGGATYTEESLEQGDRAVQALLCPPQRLVEKINNNAFSFVQSNEE